MTAAAAAVMVSSLPPEARRPPAFGMTRAHGKNSIINSYGDFYSLSELEKSSTGLPSGLEEKKSSLEGRSSMPSQIFIAPGRLGSTPRVHGDAALTKEGATYTARRKRKAMLKTTRNIHKILHYSNKETFPVKLACKCEYNNGVLSEQCYHRLYINDIISRHDVNAIKDEKDSNTHSSNINEYNYQLMCPCTDTSHQLSVSIISSARQCSDGITVHHHLPPHHHQHHQSISLSNSCHDSFHHSTSFTCEPGTDKSACSPSTSQPCYPISISSRSHLSPPSPTFISSRLSNMLPSNSMFINSPADGIIPPDDNICPTSTSSMTHAGSNFNNSKSPHHFLFNTNLTNFKSSFGKYKCSKVIKRPFILQKAKTIKPMMVSRYSQIGVHAQENSLLHDKVNIETLKSRTKIVRTNSTVHNGNNVISSPKRTSKHSGIFSRFTAKSMLVLLLLAMLGNVKSYEHADACFNVKCK